jgi:methionine synthase II (cobalamin-independent)
MARAAGGHPFKVTFPAASIFTHPLTTVAGPNGGGYRSLEEFVQHAIEIERQLVADAIAAGARYVQFDLVLLTNPMVRQFQNWPQGLPRSAMSPAASGGRTGEPVTEEDF